MAFISNLLIMNIVIFALLMVQPTTMENDDTNRLIERQTMIDNNKKKEKRCCFCKGKRETIKVRDAAKDGDNNILTGECYIYRPNKSWISKLCCLTDNPLKGYTNTDGIKYEEYKKQFPISEISKSNTLENSGFELITLDIGTQDKVLPLLEESFRRDTGNVELEKEEEIINHFKRILLKHLKKEKKYADKNIDLLHMHISFPRSTDRSTRQRGVVSKFHIDFAGLDENSTPDEFFRAREKTIQGNDLRLSPPEFETKVKNGKPIEVINIWGPLFENISQDILGFLPPGKHKCAVIPGDQKIGFTCLDSDDYYCTRLSKTPITLKSNMKRGEVYFFRTSGPNAPPHASITIQGRKNAPRRSFELRFIVMEEI